MENRFWKNAGGLNEDRSKEIRVVDPISGGGGGVKGPLGIGLSSDKASHHAAA
jgi:hypothetical protein